MKLEEQVCSLELSKKLKTLGVKQESTFYWIPFKCWNPKTKKSDNEWWKLEDKFEGQKNSKDQWSRKYSAFTVAELGEMLGGGYITVGNASVIIHGKPTYICCHYTELKYRETTPEGVFASGKEVQFPRTIEAITEADARAKMLIHLIENGIVTTNAKKENI